jgi:aminoglycoside/choline kinase family phosphotransferase
VNDKAKELESVQMEITIEQFLKKFGDYEKVIPLAKEASVRNYYRVYYENETAILCIDENFKEFPYPFLEVQEYLQNEKFLVPKVKGYDLQLKAILQSDVGDRNLTHLNEEEYSEKLKESLDILLLLQEKKPISIIQSRSFDSAKFQFELQFLLSAWERFSTKYKIQASIDPPGMEFLENTIQFLAKFPNKVICHRDFHARNLHILNNQIYMIDFQDMMMGTPQYDLASILYDAYKIISLEEREKHYTYFKLNSPHKNNRFREYYLTQCLQRSLKALGSYLYLYNDKGYEKYKPSISHCLDNLIEIIQLGGFPNSIYLFVYLFQQHWKEIISNR